MTFSVAEPFARHHAHAAGITDAMLRGPGFRRLLRGVYVSARVELTLHLWLLAALLAAPPGSVISHVTALRRYGYEVGDLLPLHLSTRTSSRSRQDDLIVHRRQAPIPVRDVRGVPVTEPARTLVDLAYDVDVPRLIEAVEWMIHRGLVSIDQLTVFVLEHHLRGVRRIRQVIGFVRDGSESPMETRVRLMIRFAHLPEPSPNVVIRDDDGLFLARGDLVYARWKLLVEYDGRHHERDPRQRHRDIGRRERLEAAGWRVIVVTSPDLRSPRQIVLRVHRALVLSGWSGPPPVFSIIWETWFPAARERA